MKETGYELFLQKLTQESPKKKPLHMAKFLQYFVLFMITVIVVLPLLIIFMSAFKSPVEINQMTPLNVPKSLYFGSFLATFEQANIALAFFNTLLIDAISVLINVLIGATASYVLARFDFKLKKLVMGIFLVAMLIPFYTIEVARFKIIRDLHLYNTLFAPILIYIGADIMQIFVYKQYIDKIPISLDESSMIDGASYFKIFRSVIFPLIMPAVATLAVIKFVDIANDMYIPFLYIPSDKLRTLTIALMSFAGQWSVDWGSISACVVWVLIPTLAVYVFFQRYILQGVMAGAIKE